MSNVRSTGKKSSNTLVRDLVNVGIFAALYIVDVSTGTAYYIIPLED